MKVATGFGNRLKGTRSLRNPYFIFGLVVIFLAFAYGDFCAAAYDFDIYTRFYAEYNPNNPFEIVPGIIRDLMISILCGLIAFQPHQDRWAYGLWVFIFLGSIDQLTNRILGSSGFDWVGISFAFVFSIISTYRWNR